MVCPIHSTQRDLCRQYQKKYREKVHSVSVSSSLKQELEVRRWEGRVVRGVEGGYGMGGWLGEGASCGIGPLMAHTYSSQSSYPIEHNTALPSTCPLS